MSRATLDLWVGIFVALGLGMLTAGIILAFMILPFICAITRDVFQLVPNVVKEAEPDPRVASKEKTRSHLPGPPKGRPAPGFPAEVIAGSPERR